MNETRQDKVGEKGGCGCREAGPCTCRAGSGPNWIWLAVAVLVLLLVWRLLVKVAPPAAEVVPGQAVPVSTK